MTSSSSRSMSYSTTRAVGQARRQHKRLFGRQKLPIEEVIQRPFVDGEEFGSRLDADLLGDAAWEDSRDTNHGEYEKR